MGELIIRSGVLVQYQGDDKRVVIPETVRMIGRFAFTNCTSLEEVIIPLSVHTIFDRAFEGCSSLKSMTIPYTVRSVGSYAFKSCTSLEKVVLPEGVMGTHISRDVFEDTPKLTDKNGFVILAGCLFGYYGNSENVIIPETVNRLNHCAFVDNSIVKSVSIPDSVTEISKQAFLNCTSLKSVTIPKSVTSILEGAFCGCSSLESVVIPDGVGKIGIQAFSNCTSLKSLFVSDSVELIGTQAFAFCSSLESVRLPQNIKTINGSVFYDDYKLADDNGFIVIDGVLRGYLNKTNDIVIPDSVRVIGTRVFEKDISIKSVFIPSSVKVIGSHAFEGCSALQNVTISEGVEVIESGAFKDCTSLNQVSIPNSVVEIEIIAFNAACSLCVKNPELLKYLNVTSGLMGFIDKYSDFTESERKLYFDYFRKHAASLARFAVSEIRLLKIMLDNNCLKRRMKDYYLSIADMKQNIEAKALILSYSKKLGTDTDFDLGDSI